MPISMRAEAGSWLSRMSSSLSSKGINFVELISCYKDTMFVIEQKDMMAAFDTLNQIISM